MHKRQSGILLHITSLAGTDCIGDLGQPAFEFVDFLASAHQTLWQILPLTPTDPLCGNSPYSSHSAFAGNVLLINPEELVEDDLLDGDDIDLLTDHNHAKVDYEQASRVRLPLLKKAYENFERGSELTKDFKNFCEREHFWLNDYALFCALKEKFKGACWNQWSDLYKHRDADTLQKFSADALGRLNYFKFVQFLFDRQWKQLKNYANEHGVSIIGDLPIYVSYDSADVWSEPSNFKLNRNDEMSVVSGVPPDYFSKTGQRWGNPVYDWDYMLNDDFSWWKKRISHNLHLYDSIRIDHFRALVNYWEIPAKHKTALKGYWEKVPTDQFFAALQDEFDELDVIAEDLGMIDDETRSKIDALGYPGMKILMFAFGGDMEEHIYLPHNFKENCVVYTGTHDNNTIYGWYQKEATKSEKSNLAEYVQKYSDRYDAQHFEASVHWHLIELALSSAACKAIIPMQDLLGLDGKARMNVPGTSKNNWTWRLAEGQANASLADHMAELTRRTRR